MAYPSNLLAPDEHIKFETKPHWRALFVPLIVLLEGEIILNNFSKFFSPVFWAGMSFAGCLGFAIGIVTVMQIKATSPLTHNISGTAKAAVQSIMAFYIWGNQPTFKGLLGIAFVLLGSSFYTYVAMKENARKRALPTTHKVPAKPIASS